MSRHHHIAACRVEGAALPTPSRSADLIGGMTPQHHHLPRRRLVSQRAITRCCEHDWESRPPLPVRWVLREAKQTIALLDTAPAVIDHCLSRGSMAPDPGDLRDYAEAFARWLRTASAHRVPWVADIMRRVADQLDEAADRLWLAMVRRGG